jgi:hypothetical protein
MARALGAHAERVEDPAQLANAIKRGLANAPAVIDVVTSQDAVSSDATKGLGFVPTYQPLAGWDDAERKRNARSLASEFDHVGRDGGGKAALSTRRHGRRAAMQRHDR